jgi:hypothetical protein
MLRRGERETIMHRCAAAFVLGLAAQPAMAEGYFQADMGSWHIFGKGTICTALNRPPLEFNMAPYNALQIRLDDKRQYELSVFFWPDAVPESVSKIALTAEPNDTIRLKAKLIARDIGMVTVTEPLPQEFVRSLESGARLTFLQAEVPDSKAKTDFDISAAPQVMAHLQTCAGVLARSAKE